MTGPAGDWAAKSAAVTPQTPAAAGASGMPHPAAGRALTRQAGGVQVLVWVADWQYQCCGDWFEVGSWVSWSLTVDDGFLQRALGSQAPSRPVTVQVLASASADGSDGIVAGAAGGLRVFIGEDSGRVPARGDSLEVALLVEDHHIDVPETMPRTRGLVSRIRLARFG